MEGIQSTINQLSAVTNPGVYIDPKSMSMNFTPSSSTGGDYYSREQIQNDLYGKANPLESSRPFIDTNGFIQYTHSQVSWTNNAELYISSGMVLFAQKFKQTDGLPLVPDMTLAMFNTMLYQSWLTFQKDAQDAQNQDIIDFSNYLNNGDIEDRLLSIHNKRKKNKKLTEKEIRLWSLATNARFTDLTKHGILQKYNYIGVAMTDGTSTGNRDINLLEYQSKITNVNVCFAKRCNVANIWGSPKLVHPGTKLFLMLTQDPKGFYKVVPKTSFRDARLNSQSNHVWYIGYVKYPITRFGPASAIKTAISGSNPESVYKAIGRLEMMEVNLGI